MDAIDFARYVWRNDETVPTRMKREVGGGELIQDVWNYFNDGDTTLYTGLYISIAQPQVPLAFVDLLKKAWISLRWDIPTVAAQILHEPREGSPMSASFLTYDLPANLSDVKAWADHTVVFKEGFKDLDALHDEVAQGLLPSKDLDIQTFMYVLHFSDTEYGLLLYTSHTPFDGAGLKMVGTRLLEHLSHYISDSTYASSETSRMKWGTEADRLLPIASEVLRKHEPAEFDALGSMIKPEMPKEPREGPAYYETLQKVMSDLAKGGPLSHPFKSLKQYPPGEPKQKPRNMRASHTFTTEESKQIIISCSLAGNGPDKLTVNQLLHGALCLLTIMDNPPAPSSPNAVFFYGLADCRHRLLEQYRGAEGYPGYCLGMSAIQVPVAIADKFSLTKGASADVKAAVFEFARAVKQEYKQQAALPALLAIENQQVELMLSAPPPPPWCGPWFSGDGRGAIYLKPKYPQSGPTVVEIKDFILGVNKNDPGPFFRATEWNGRIKLSADYNERAVDPSVVANWMKKWAELILTTST